VSRAGSQGANGRQARRSRGQSLVEFALIFPIFLGMLFGLIDAGRLIYLNSTLSQAAREAGRLGAVEAYWLGSTATDCNQPNGPVCPANNAALIADMRGAANRMMAPFGAVTDVHVQCSPEGSPAPAPNWTGNTCANRDPGDDVLLVRVTATYTAITPIVGQLIGPTTLSGSSTFVIN